jgi:hypothetical protein
MYGEIEALLSPRTVEAYRGGSRELFLGRESLYHFGLLCLFWGFYGLVEGYP